MAANNSERAPRDRPAGWLIALAAAMFLGAWAGLCVRATRALVDGTAIAGIGICGLGAACPRAAPVSLVMSGFLLGSAALAAGDVAVIPSGPFAESLADRWVPARKFSGGDSPGGDAALVVVRGVIDGLPILDNAGAEFGGARQQQESELWRFLLLASGAEVDGKTFRGRAYFWVYLDGAPKPEWIGREIRVLAALQRASPRDSQSLQWSRAPAWGSLRSRIAAVEPTGQAEEPPPESWIQQFRFAISSGLDRQLDGVARGIARALILGVYDGIPRDVLRAHARTGTLPFLAISGVHVSLLVGVLTFLWRGGGVRWRRAAALVALLFVYSAAAGHGSPVFRATIGLCCVLASQAGGRAPARYTPVAAPLCLDLLLWPRDAFSPGFQLSYAAVLGFVAFLPRMRAPAGLLLAKLPATLRPAAAWLLLNLAFSAVAFCATAGICVLHFGQLAPASILLNIPLSILFLPMLCFGWGAALPGPAGAISAAAFCCVEAVERALVCSTAALAPPYCCSAFFAPAIGAAGLGILCCAARRWLWAGFLAFAGLLCLEWVPRAELGSVQIWIHDVGHGLAATVALPDGTAAQIDAGSRDRREICDRKLRQSFDRAGIVRFAILSISHDDADHANAGRDLLDRYQVGRVVIRRGSPWARILEAQESEGGRSPSAASLEGGGARIRWIPVDAGAGAKSNDRAIATILEFGGRRVLFPADLERAGIELLFASIANPQFDLVILPHHGLDNGQVEPLLDHANPLLAFASNGAAYSTKSTERELARRGIPFLSTRDLGTLHIRIAPDGAVTVTSER